MGKLVNSGVPNAIQAFVPNPSYSSTVTLSIGQHYLLAPSTEADLNISGWNFIRIFSPSPIYRYFNTNTDTVYPIIDEVGLILHDDVTSLTLVNDGAAAVTIYIEGA
jgi:hypothetical protein